jgi:membrane protease YdiL (CAAX protease family)
MMICATAGAIPLGISVARFPRSALKPLLACLATAGVLGPILMLGGRRLNFTGLHLASTSGLFAALQYFLLALPAWFVAEEVFFRGGMDSFLHRPNDHHPWVSATFISLLWGLWHLPFYSRDWAASGRDHRLLNCLAFSLGAVPLGIPLSLAWRRSGLLLIPALVHAFIDAAPRLFTRLP